MESLAGAVYLTLGLVVVGGYLLGSIPFGLLSARIAGIDIRTVGSGNIGATNVLRTGRKDLALLALIGDSGKGALAVLLAGLLTHWTPLVMALAAGAAFTGHLFPVWLKFKGGKGVATFFGTMLAIAWPVGLLAGAAWLLTAFLFRMSSLAGLTAVALAPFFALATEQPYPVVVLAAFMAVLVFIRHRENIGRLLKGTEPKIGAKKDAPPAA
ncbi:glycerol-3-phosphate 1-O-acyltransferase PlsY [Caulobacter sp. NIBR1757]|uniref:glycerol-3-phosphate 1-O-acyltransferase PlsY n=1 Tax=Caulobacter sp. NIBR1757 TaxID=3016000 RepID=UPI0022F0ABDB|nr:glycerol-3-phosphate 1-O-acyltransferase PlsY [Caulobacter sp. NIBR1757]WGM39248.1 Glycerol-3-phosphate acyltransferase [Caulobacter sp. NIBR1757]